jgi:hypothetical protein
MRKIHFLWHRFWANRHREAFLELSKHQSPDKRDGAEYSLKRFSYHARKQVEAHPFGKGWYNRF